VRSLVVVCVVVAASLTMAACSTPPPPGLSVEQVAQITAARSPSEEGLTRPIYTYVPIVEWGSAVAECMNRAGYASYSAAVVSFTRGEAGLPGAGEQNALDTCLTVIQVDPVDRNILSREQLEYIYSYYARQLIPCLAEHGIEITDVPTREDFELSIFIDGEFGYSTWSPYEGLSASPKKVFDDCPPSPPGYAYALEDWRA
jgi:hypothetical protein